MLRQLASLCLRSLSESPKEIGIAVLSDAVRRAVVYRSYIGNPLVTGLFPAP
jgi:hypothetical protein